MKKLALLLAVLMIVSLIPVGAVEVAKVETAAEQQGAVATLSAGKATPEKKVDENLGELMAYFNFDEYVSSYDTKGNGWHFNYLPTYKSPTVKYAVVGTQYVYGLDNALYDGTAAGLGGIVFLPSYEGESGLGGLFYLEGMPAGINTLKFDIMVPTVNPISGEDVPDSALKTYYNGDGDTIDWTAVADSTGANIERDTWKAYSRTVSTPVKMEKWQFFGYKDTLAIIDNVEIWCFPSKGIILKDAETAENLEMVLLTDTAYTFPTVKSVFPNVTGKTAWTDGTTVYEVDDEIASEVLYGKKFYPCEGTSGEEDTLITVDETLGMLVGYVTFDGQGGAALEYVDPNCELNVLGAQVVSPADLALLANNASLPGSLNISGTWPAGKQTLELDVLVSSVDEFGDEVAASSLRPYFNGDGDNTDWGTSIPGKSGANDARDTWKPFSWTVTGSKNIATWQFMSSNGYELVDNIKVWCYPDNGFILKNSKAGRKMQMAMSDDNGKYTFPTPSSIFPTVPSDKTSWTNGVLTFASGEEIDATSIAGVSFYPCEADTPTLVYTPTPVPTKKVDDTLGELVGFFNFDDFTGSFIYPAYAAEGYSPRFGPGYGHSADSWIKFGTVAGIESNVLRVYDSGAYGMFGIGSTIQGNHTIKFRIMVPKGEDDSAMKTFFNNNGDYIDWENTAPGSTGANAEKGTWKNYSRTVTAMGLFRWDFFAESTELIDDVEIWVYPEDGFILRPELGSDDGVMVRCADGTDYTIPAVADTFASATGTVWTDGSNLYNAGDVVTASQLHGKIIYVYGGEELSKYNPTPVPAMKDSKELGEMIAFFNFDTFKTGRTNKYPSYWEAGIRLVNDTADDYIAAFGTVGTDDVVVSNAAMPSLNGGSLKIGDTHSSETSAAGRTAWPIGKQSIKFKIFVPADGADSTLKVKFNNEAAVDVAAEANANKGTWKEVCVTAEGKNAASWEFIDGTTEIIDDVEIWVFTDDAYIVEDAKDSDNFMVLHCTTATFTFPSVADVFPTSTEVKWTDGIQAYDEGDTVEASDIIGKTFYPGEDTIGAPKNEGNPEATDYLMTAAVRFKASVTTAQREAMEKFGFLVSTEILLDKCGTNVLDHNAVSGGVKYYKEAIAFDSTKQIIFEETAKKTTFSLVAYNIPDDMLDETILVRAFMVVQGHMLYGKTVETSYNNA